MSSIWNIWAKTQKCEKVCKENKLFNEETFECGIWDEGTIYNIELLNKNNNIINYFFFIFNNFNKVEI